jgi:hypothetical protein
MNLVKRNLNFKTLIRELTLMGEYDIFDLSERVWTPYIFAGIGGFKFSPYTTDSIYGKVFLHGVATEGQGLADFRREKYIKNPAEYPFGAESSMPCLTISTCRLK